MGPSEITYQSSHPQGPYTGHTYKSTRMRPFQIDRAEGQQLTSRDLIHRGTYPESNFHKDTTYYSSPRALGRTQTETIHEDKAFCQLPVREASMHQARFLPSVSEPGGFPSQLKPQTQTHSQMLSEGHRPLLRPHSIQRALPKYLSPNNGSGRLSMVDWIKTAKQKHALVDDVYLKTAKHSEDSIALRKPILQVAPIRPFSLPPNRFPSFTSIREATSQQRSVGSRDQMPQMNYAKSLSRNAAPTPPPTNNPPTACYPETISSPLNRSPQYGNIMLQSKTRFHEGPRATVDVSRISEMKFNERPQYELRSSKPTDKEQPRVAIDTQLTETQLSFQNPSEPRKLLLGLPNENTEKFVKWYKGPGRQEEQSHVATSNTSSSVGPPKLNPQQPLQPSDFPVLEYQRRSNATDNLDKTQTCSSSHGQPRLETGSSKSPHNPSQASYSDEKNNIKGSSRRPTMKSVSVEAKPNERIGDNGGQRLHQEMQKRKFPQPPTKGRQYLTSLIRDEQNRVNCEDYNPQRDLPYWFTQSELILLNDNMRTPGQLPPEQQKMIEPWERDSINFSNAHISNFTEGSVVSDPLPISNQLKSQPANSRVMSLQALPSSLCNRIDSDIGIQNGSWPPPIRRSMDNSNVPKQNPRYMRPWCHLGSGGDSGYVLQAPAVRRRLDRSNNKEPMVRMMTAMNPMVTAPSNNGDCNTVIVPNKVLLFCKKGILTLPSPYDVPTVNSFCQPKDMITFNKELPPNSMDYRRARFSINLDGFLDEDIYFFTDKDGHRLIVEGRRPKRENANARRLVETIDLPPGLQPENLKVARDYKGILHFEEAWVF